ncbi:MAG TPA: DUF502 domain-containing protein [Vicinamibacteria bacterium]|nr:DUF502 domain-containing protein [Vicinamibacteria bacterium]
MKAPPRLPPILRSKFIAGLVILIPIIVTTKALVWLFSYLDGLAEPLAVAVLGRPVPGMGFALTVGVVFLTGVLFSSGPLRRLLDGADEMLGIVPVVGAVYGTTKKVLEGFGKDESSAAFKRFVLARLPGRTTPGFLTGSFTLKRADGSAQMLCTVYVPTNHLYVGDVVVIPEADVIETDLSVEDGVSLILSVGASVPAVVAETR